MRFFKKHNPLIYGVLSVIAGAIMLVPQATRASSSQLELLIKFRGSQEISYRSFATSSEMFQQWSTLALDPRVEYVERNAHYHAVLAPNDPFVPEQWSLQKTGAETAWDTQTGNSKITIAILDSGVDITHPDLVNNIWTNSGEIPGNGIDDDRNGYIDDVHGWDFVNGNNDPEPKFQTGWNETGALHGTVVAGIADAEGNNAQGVAGVSWHVKIMPVKTLGDDGIGSTLTVAQGVKYAVENGADIINLSFVGSDNSIILANAIADARASGVVVVAAAGNDNLNLDATRQYPVCNTGVIGVASTDQNDQKTSFSNYGSCISISAPGIDMTSTLFVSPEHGLSSYYGGGWYGTSTSAPFISGALALAKSVNPNMSGTELESALRGAAVNLDSTNPQYAGKLGSGRIDLASLVGSGTVSVIKDYLVTSMGAGGVPQVNLTKPDGSAVASFDAFDPKFRGGVNVAAGDINGDGTAEIIAGAGTGGGPQVRVFDSKGKLLSQFFAYDPKFRGGVRVGAADVNADGKEETVTGPGVGGGPQVRIFSSAGSLVEQFFPYDQSLRSGVSAQKYAR